jgi:arsenical pump membrane protein
VAIATTFIMLRFTQRKELAQFIETEIPVPKLSKGGRTALIGIAITAVILLAASALDVQLGLPTAITGIVISAVVTGSARKNPMVIIKGVSWAVLPLVAALFVMVEGLNKTGLSQTLTHILQQQVAHSVTQTAWGSGVIIAYVCNLTNNLPAGLIAGNILQAGHAPDMVKSAVLIGVDLGPNLSITGSLATILWLVALRREGITVSAWAFLKLGILIMTVALLLTLALLAI